MNMHSQTDIDRAISAACDLHDDRAGEASSRRPERRRAPVGLLDGTGNDDAPEFESDDRSRVFALVLGGSSSDYVRCHAMVGDLHDRERGPGETDDDLSAIEVLASDADDADALVVFLRGWGRTIASGRKSKRQFEEITARAREAGYSESMFQEWWKETDRDRLQQLYFRFKEALLPIAWRVALLPDDGSEADEFKLGARWFVWMTETDLALAKKQGTYPVAAGASTPI